MIQDPHDLVSEFPEFRDAIHHLKENDKHFRRLFDEYHVIDKEIHRFEAGVENPSDAYTEECKKKRLKLKDQLFDILKEAAA